MRSRELNQAEEMHRLIVPGIDLQNFCAELVGIIRVAGGVEAQSIVKKIVNGLGGHADKRNRCGGCRQAKAC
jgi:hypothetical protein